MPPPSGPPVPGPDLGDHAYGHALFVVGSPGARVVGVASRGLLRGGRSRTAVLGHTRAAALETPAGPGPEGPYRSVTELAFALAASRPAVERALVDLEGRHGLPRGAFARAAGLAPSAAVARVAAVAQAWSDELDPALLAWFGPGDCEGLASVLADVGPEPGADSLLGVAPAVAAHAESCDVCADRRRALVSVRSLVVGVPLPDAPTELHELARSGRRRPPLPPPPLAPRRSGRWAWAALAACVAALVTVGAVAGARALRDRGSTRGKRVEALTALPGGTGGLALSQSTFTTASAYFDVFNRSARALNWQAKPTVPWLTVTPSSGRLSAGDSTVVRLRFLDSAPEGDLKATITFTSDTGGTVGMTATGTLERPPDLAAHRNGCNVVARAEDEGKVADVTLHWREARVERTAALAGNAQSQDYRATLPPSATSWWVTAVDARGNVASTVEERLPTSGC